MTQEPWLTPALIAKELLHLAAVRGKIPRGHVERKVGIAELSLSLDDFDALLEVMIEKIGLRVLLDDAMKRNNWARFAKDDIAVFVSLDKLGDGYLLGLNIWDRWLREPSFAEFKLEL